MHTLSLHDALPISSDRERAQREHPLASRSAQHETWVERLAGRARRPDARHATPEPARWRPRCEQARRAQARSEEHTSELQSLRHLVCRLLPEKKNQTTLPKQISSIVHLKGQDDRKNRRLSIAY